MEDDLKKMKMEDDLNFKVVLLSWFNNKNLKNEWFWHHRDWPSLYTVLVEITRYHSLLWRFTDYFIQSLHANWDKHVWGRNILARQAFLSIIHGAAWKMDWIKQMWFQMLAKNPNNQYVLYVGQAS